MAGTTVSGYRQACCLATGYWLQPHQRRGPALAPSAPVQSQKSVQLRKIVGDQFRANKHVTDAATLHRLKST